MSNKNLETRTLLDEIRNFDKGSVFFDLGHPLLNRIAQSFIKAAGIGAIQAVLREAYFTALEGTGVETGRVPPEITTGKKKYRFPDLTVKGEFVWDLTYRKASHYHTMGLSGLIMRWRGALG